MNYRATNVFAQKAYTADFTELIDINLADPVSEIRLNYSGLNAAGSAGSTAHWSKCITKVELVDGSDVLFSLSGLVLYALGWLHYKKAPSQWLHYLVGNYFDIVLRIPFGRFLWDPMLALTPRSFKNLQLRIQSTMAAGGVAPTASRLDVWALCFDEKMPSPIGLLTAREIKQYTMGDASHEYTDLPMDQKIRKLMVKTLVAGTEAVQVLANLKLSEDNDRHVIIDASSALINRIFDEENIQIQEGFIFQNDGSQRSYHCTPTSQCVLNANEWAAAASAYFAVYDGDGGRAKIDGSAGVNGICQIQGFNPNGVFSVPLGDQNDPEDWFDPSGLKNLQLDLKSASSMTNTCEIILQQLRQY
jgi:hypothetical protein